MEQIAHSRIDIVEQPTVEPSGFATAAIKSCCGCGVIISGMGGGGTYLCKPCVKVLTAGLLTREFQAAHEEFGA